MLWRKLPGGGVLIGIALMVVVFALPAWAASAPQATTPPGAVSSASPGPDIVEGVDPGSGQPVDSTGVGSQLDPSATALLGQLEIWPVLLALDLVVVVWIALLVRRRRADVEKT